MKKQSLCSVVFGLAAVLVFAFGGPSAQAEAGATGAMHSPTREKSLKSAVAPISIGYAHLTYVNANEEAAPGLFYDLRVFKGKIVRHRFYDGRDPVTHRRLYHYETTTVWVRFGHYGTNLDAGGTLGFTKKFGFRGEFQLRGEAWQGTTLVASREVSGDVAGTVDIPLTFGSFAPTGGTTGGTQKATIAIHDGVNGVSGTPVSFTAVLLYGATATDADLNDPAKALVSVPFTAGIGNTLLDYQETGTASNIPAGTYRVVVVSNNTAIGNFWFSGTTTIAAGATVNLDMRLQ